MCRLSGTIHVNSLAQGLRTESTQLVLTGMIDWAPTMCPSLLFILEPWRATWHLALFSCSGSTQHPFTSSAYVSWLSSYLTFLAPFLPFFTPSITYSSGLFHRAHSVFMALRQVWDLHVALSRAGGGQRSVVSHSSSEVWWQGRAYRALWEARRGPLVSRQKGPLLEITMGSCEPLGKSRLNRASHSVPKTIHMGISMMRPGLGSGY